MMGKNKENEPKVYNVGRVKIVDPNPLNELNVDLSDLSISVELTAEVKERTLLTKTKAYNESNQKDGIIRFIQGSTASQSGQNSFTTNYTEIGNKNYKDNFESFGIDSINIDFNSSLAPLVTIKFIDVRAAMLFQQGNESKYNVFFNMPYPIFNLTIKGYFGKAVVYRLHLTKFNTVFEATTGNFICTGQFIGYTYAFLSDMLIGYLRGAVETTTGKALLQKKGVISINQLRNLVENIDKDIANIKNSDTDVQSLILSQDVINKAISIKGDIDTITSNNSDGFLDKDLYTNYGIAVLKSSDLANVNTFSNFIKNLKLQVDSINKISESIKLKPNPDDILVKNNAAFLTNLEKTNNYSELLVLNKDSSTLTILDFGKFNTGLSDFVNNLNKNLDNNKSVVNEKIKTLIENKIGFTPSIGNIFKILCAHSDVLMEMLTDLAKKIELENQNTSSPRNKIAKNIFENTDNNNNIINKVIHPFPKYVKNVNGADELAWIGDDYPNLAEVAFVEDLLRGLLVVKEGDEKYGTDSATVKEGWVGINPMESYLLTGNTENPFKDIEKSSIDNIIKTMILRATTYMNYSNNPSKLDDNQIQDIAKIEANNLFSNITNSSVKDGILSRKDSIISLMSTDNPSYAYNNNKSGKLFNSNTSYLSEVSTTPTATGTVIVSNPTKSNFYTYNYLQSLNTNNNYLTTKNITDNNFIVDKSDGNGLYGSISKNSNWKDINTVLENKIKYIDIISSNDASNISARQQPAYLETVAKGKTEKYYGTTGYKEVTKTVENNIFCEINYFKGLKQITDYKNKLSTYSKIYENINNYFVPLLYSDFIKGAQDLNLFGNKTFNLIEHNLTSKTDIDNARAFMLLCSLVINIGSLDDVFTSLKKEASILKLPRITVLAMGALIWRKINHEKLKFLNFDLINDENLFKKFNELDILPKSVTEKLLNYFYNFTKAGGEYEQIYNNLKLFDVVPTVANWDNIYITFKSNHNTSIFGNSIKNYSTVTYMEKETVDLEKSYYCLFKPNTTGQDNLKNLISERVNFVNSTWRIWEDANKVTLKYSISAEKINTFFKTFFTEFQTLKVNDQQNTNVEKSTNELRSVINNKFIKFNTYITLKNIYDKWVGGDEFQNVFKSFKFIDRAFLNIADIFLLNPKAFVNNMVGNFNQSLYDLISRTLSDNYMEFIPLPSYIDYNKDEEMKAMFTPYTYKDVYTNEENKQSEPTFICMYVGDKSKHLDLGKTSTFKNDGIIFEDGKIPSDLQVKNGDNNLGNIPAFMVNFGQSNQSIFTDPQLDQSEFTETDESLKITDAISRSGNPFSKDFLGQNLFNVYSKRSYSCSIKAKGNMMIQPMTYFQLNNIPMFRGAYLITRVQHNIRPNTMDTTFTGVRIKYDKTPLIDSSVAFMDILGSFTAADVKAGSKIGDYKGIITKSKQAIIDNIKAMEKKTITLTDGSSHVVTQEDVNFLMTMAARESSYDPNVVNQFGYMGLYQFGKSALKTVNISVSEYKNDIEKQHLAVLRYKYFNLNVLKHYNTKYKNKPFRGVTVTENGLAAAAHLGGSGNAQNFFNETKPVFVDGNNVPLTVYFNLFT